MSKSGNQESCDRKHNRYIDNIRKIFIEHLQKQTKKYYFLKKQFVSKLNTNEHFLKENGVVDGTIK